MPWKESNTMSERLKFVARHLDGERMSDLCREFGIARKTGYKLVERYEKEGVDAFGFRSRAPQNHPNRTPAKVEESVVELRNHHPTWGAPKIKSYLERTLSGVPAKSTIQAILDRHQLTKKRRRRRAIGKASGTMLSKPSEPNDLWCADFKGQFKLLNRIYCYPLTVTDQVSRFLLECEGFENNSENQCLRAFHDLFLKYGLPGSMRTDNGVPFGSRSIFGLSKLSVFWIRLGIKIERIIPGHPEENGCHERMHKTLKADATQPPSGNILSQQERFDAYKEIFNRERPHHALGMKSPAEIYRPSTRIYDPHLEPLSYPDHDITTRVTNCGKIFVSNRRHQMNVYIGIPFAGYNLGLKDIGDGIWQVNFMDYLMGYFDMDLQQIQVPVNPFLQERL